MLHKFLVVVASSEILLEYASDVGHLSGRDVSSVPHFDYQLGGPYVPRENVSTVVRDKSDPSISGLYDVCYMNGIQTQPAEGKAPHWHDDYKLKLKDEDDTFVVDDKWKEFVLDIRTERKRRRLIEIIAPWNVKCAQDGFDAIEIDSMDT